MSWVLKNSSNTVIANYTGDSITLSALATGTYTLSANSGDDEDKVTVSVTRGTMQHSGGAN